VVFVLSSHFVRKKYPMLELMQVMERASAGKQLLLPVLYRSLPYDKACKLEEFYKQEWPAAEPKRAEHELKKWSEVVRDLLKVKSAIVDSEQVRQMAPVSLCPSVYL
jgi:hypothetical protein